jgi:hypothetical protein
MGYYVQTSAALPDFSKVCCRDETTQLRRKTSQAAIEVGIDCHAASTEIQPEGAGFSSVLLSA